MQRRVRLVDLVTPREPISPDPTELVKVIETSARDEDQIFNGRQCRLQKAGNLLRAIADESRPEQNKRTLLACIDIAIKKSACECEPRRRTQIVLVIDLRPLKELVRRANKSVFIGIID